MAGTNFLQHNPSENNQETDTTYASDTARLNGLVTGQLVPSLWLNKILYQISTFITAFANMMVIKGYTLVDTNLATLTTALSNILTKADFNTGGSTGNNWEISPTGKVTQWGIAGPVPTGDNKAYLTITFPNSSAFTTTPQVFCQTNNRADNTDSGAAYVLNSGPIDITTTGFRACITCNTVLGGHGSGNITNVVDINWYAIGN